ncbi:MAG: transposase [Holosporales bacterium]|nr:transposase [Holosporales bacterium]
MGGPVYREELNVGKPTVTDNYYVCNKELSIEEFAKYIRQHWGIENKLHYVKDVTMREDFTTKRRNPFIFSFCMAAVLNIMRVKNETNISEALHINGMRLSECIEKYREIL